MTEQTLHLRGCKELHIAPAIEGADFGMSLLIAAVIIGAAIMLVTMFAIFRVMAFLSPGRSGLLMMTEVIVAVFSAAIFLPEEALSFWEWVGAGLIITAGVIEVTGGEA